jgi:AraC-like DNA-binding protein
VAQDCGFADQAHMTRAVVKLTGTTPSALRALKSADPVHLDATRVGARPAHPAPTR